MDDLEEESISTSHTVSNATPMPGQEDTKNITSWQPAKKDDSDNENEDDDKVDHGALKKKPVVVDVDEPVVISKTSTNA